MAVTDHEGPETVPLVRQLTSTLLFRDTPGPARPQLIFVANCSNTFTLSVTHPSILGNTKTAAVHFEEVCLWTEAFGGF